MKIPLSKPDISWEGIESVYEVLRTDNLSICNQKRNLKGKFARTLKRRTQIAQKYNKGLKKILEKNPNKRP